MAGFRKYFGRLKVGKAGEASTTEGTVPPGLSTTTESMAPAVTSGMTTTNAAPPEQGPDLYSTEGSIGMKVVAEPTDAVLEYVQFHNRNGRFIDKAPLTASSLYMA